MVVRNLEFFDKDGYNLNLNWNEERKIWEGNIFFPRVSVGLYRNTTIYIVENICSDSDGYDSDYTNDIYTYPNGVGNIVFHWDLANSFVDEFFMFNFDEDYIIKDTSSLSQTPYDGPSCETLLINRFDKYIVPLLDSSNNIEQDDLLEVHIAFRATEGSAETTYKRTLVISYENGYTKHDIARITFFAETVEEDERLKIWNENLGYNLKPEDSVIFKHSDIHEYMPNYEILNEKRKELMLEGHNIYPYIGGYKAILNAIKFFGYDNLNIVEYWRNIDRYDSEFGNIYRTYVYSIKDRKSLSTKRRPISLNTKKFKKLNNISLVYNINHPDMIDGEKYDEYGLPNVIEDFDKDKRDDFVLTIEEAMVKLFALRKKLNEEFMPGSSRVSDIIGEGNYFGLNLIGSNSSVSNVNYITSNNHINFSVFPNKHCYLTENEDFARYIAEVSEINVGKSIRELGDKTISEIEEMYEDNTINEIDQELLGDVIDNLIKEDIGIVCDYYEDYYNLIDNNIFGNSNEYGLRDAPEPRNIYMDNDSDSDDNFPNIEVCAKVILKGEFGDDIDITSLIEWKIIHREWGVIETYKGDIKTFMNIFVQLPYLGNYDVEMTVWDAYNHCSRLYTKDAIIVDPYNIDIRGFYYDARLLPNDMKYDLIIPNKDKQKYYQWKKRDGEEKIFTIERNPSEISITDILGDINKENWISIVDMDDNTLNISWMYYDENGVVYGIDVFEFDGETEDDSLDINGSNLKEDSKYELYNTIKKNVDKMYSLALPEHLDKEDINSTMRNYRPDGSVSHEGPYYKFDVDTILYRIERGYKEYDHLNNDIINLYHGDNYEYVRYINSVVDIKPLTWVLLGFDYTRITGRIVNDEYPKWTLTKVCEESEEIITTHNGLYFTYLFEEEGIYKIKLELLDINDNKYEIEKPIVIVDRDANYEIYHTLKEDYNKYLEEKNERNLIYLN